MSLVTRAMQENEQKVFEEISNQRDLPPGWAKRQAMEMMGIKSNGELADHTTSPTEKPLTKEESLKLSTLQRDDRDETDDLKASVKRALDPNFKPRLKLPR